MYDVTSHVSILKYIINYVTNKYILCLMFSTFFFFLVLYNYVPLKLYGESYIPSFTPVFIQ